MIVLIGVVLVVWLPVCVFEFAGLLWFYDVPFGSFISPFGFAVEWVLGWLA